jgi:hypothetical protein
MVKDVERIHTLEGATVIYSLWKGYLEEKSMKAVLGFMARHRMQLVETHTSGHAGIRTLSAWSVSSGRGRSSLFTRSGRTGFTSSLTTCCRYLTGKRLLFNQ